MKPRKAPRRSKPQYEMNEEIFRLLFDHHPLPMWMYDLETLAFLEVNIAAVEKYGYTRNEFLKMTLTDIRPSDDETRSLDSEARWRLELQHATEWRHTLRNGRIIDVEISSHTLAYQGRKAAFVIVQEVTERKDKQKVILDSEIRHRSLFENMLEGFAYCRMLFENEKPVDFEYLEVNNAFEKVTGLKNVVGKRATEVVPGIKESTPELFEIYGRLAQTRQPTRFEIYMNPLDRWLSISVYSAHHEYFASLVTDISERKRAELALREREHKYRSIFENVQDVYYEASIDGTIFEVSPSIEIMSEGQYHRNDLIGKSLYDFYSGVGERQAFLSVLNERGSVADFEVTLKNRDGSFIPCSISSKIQFDAQGNPKTIIGSMRNIAARKRAEEALSSSERRFRELFDGAPVGYHELDIKGRIVEVNNTELEMMGYKAEEMLNHGAWEFIVETDTSRKAIAAKIAGSIPTDSTYERTYLRRDGTTLQVLLTDRPLRNEAGNVVGIRSTVQDITKRKRMEEDLRELERRFREMLENINLIALTLDTNGIITFCNDYLLTLTGWSREEVINEDWFERFIPEGLTYVKPLYTQSIATSTLPPHSEGFVLTKGGELRTIEWNNTMLRNSVGIVVGSASIGEDVTAANRILERARQLAAIVETSEDAVIGETLEGVMTSWNKGAEKIFGYTEDEVLGQNINTLAPPGRKHEVQEHLDKIRKGEHVVHNDTVRRRKDGSDLFMSLTISPVLNTEGEVVAASAIGRDVTERKLAEEKIRQSEEQFRLIAENVADMIAVLDLDGRRVYNSPSYRSILGDPESLRGTDGFQEIHPEDVARVKQVFLETVRTGIGQRIEYRFLRKDGSERTIDSKGSVIRDDDGNIVHVVVVSRDVTEEKMLAAQFLRSQRMESIGTLAGGIAHDLNNVLAPIMMAIEVLRSKVSDQGGQRILSTIETSAQRGADIVRQVLAFGRGVKSDRILLQLKHVVNEVVKIAGETFPKSIDIIASIPRDLWTVSADPTQMHQVLLNMLVNARDAMPKGGTLTISAENIKLDEQYSLMHLEAKPRAYVSLSITDTGTGIPADIQAKIFEPFFTTKEIGKGTGLGLSTTLAIVRSHGGFIDLESGMGKGTTFRIYIPATGTASRATATSEEEELPTGSGELILIIDDEAAIREITKVTLQAYGYRAMTASDGAEGVALFAENKKDIKVVITDIMMPVMDGTATIAALKRISPEVKIIAASGMTTKGQVRTPSDSNVQALLTKPYTAEALLKALAGALR